MRLTDQIVERQPLGAEGGFSGNTIERVTLRDGRTLIHKRVDPDDDWISRATGDRGRLVAMWDAGLFERMPRSIEHGMVAVEADGDGWSVLMHDLSPALLPRQVRLDRAAVGRVLRAMVEVHDTFWGEALPGLCSIEDRYHLLSPLTIQRERDLGNGAEFLTRGLEAFAAHVPAGIAGAITPLVEDPTPLATALRAGEQTLIHGDLRLDNLGFSDGRVVLLDWGERSGPAPPAVELMWFLGFDALLLDCARDDVVADFRRLYGDRVSDQAMDLAFIGGLVHLACHFGLGLLGHSPTIGRLGGDEGAKRAAATDELAWWIGTVEAALERSWPVA